MYSDLGSADLKVVGVSDSHFRLSNMQVQTGRLLTEQDNKNVAQVAVIGATAAEQLFQNEQAVGQYLKVNHLWLEVSRCIK